jgi:autonomous glycyl radical cofactor GrcA
MELQSLKLVVTDADVDQVLAEFAPRDLEVRDLRVAFTPAGVRVTGATSVLLFSVSFETLWEVALRDGRVVARLSSLKVAGVAAGKLRGVLLKVLRDAVGKAPGITVEDEVVAVDVNAALRARHVPLQVRLKAVRCLDGSVVLEV